MRAASRHPFRVFLLNRHYPKSKSVVVIASTGREVCLLTWRGRKGAQPKEKYERKLMSWFVFNVLSTGVVTEEQNIRETEEEGAEEGGREEEKREEVKEKEKKSFFVVVVVVFLFLYFHSVFFSCTYTSTNFACTESWLVIGFNVLSTAQDYVRISL